MPQRLLLLLFQVVRCEEALFLTPSPGHRQCEELWCAWGLTAVDTKGGKPTYAEDLCLYPMRTETLDTLQEAVVAKATQVPPGMSTPLTVPAAPARDPDKPGAVVHVPSAPGRAAAHPTAAAFPAVNPRHQKGPSPRTIPVSAPRGPGGSPHAEGRDSHVPGGPLPLPSRLHPWLSRPWTCRRTW